MRKKRIRITGSQLYRLIGQTLNEISQRSRNRRIAEGRRKLNEYDDEEEDENSEFVEYLANAIINEAEKYAWDENFAYLEDNPYNTIPFQVKLKYQQGNEIIYGILNFEGFVSQDTYCISFIGQNCRKKILDANGNTTKGEPYYLNDDILEAVSENLSDADGREYRLDMYV